MKPFPEQTITKKIMPLLILLIALIFQQCADPVKTEVPGTVILKAPLKTYASAAVIRWSKTTSENFSLYNIIYDTQSEVSDTGILAASIIYKNDTTYLLDGLNENTTYYVKIFVHNTVSFSESNEISFTTTPCGSGVFTNERQGGMVLVPAGCFIGKDNSLASISYDLFIDTTEVTIAEWNSIMRSVSIIDTAIMSIKQWNFMLNIDTSTSREPITEISKYQMILFCNEKSRQNMRDTCYSYTSIHIDTSRSPNIDDIIDLECNFSANGFRLPTEDEWEYAYHAGQPQEFFWGKDGNTLMESPYTATYPFSKDDSLEISNYTWWDYNNEPNGIKEVASKKPNQWHLYDMAGNVEETVWDLAVTGVAREKRRIDYTGLELGPQSSKKSIVRGGSYKTTKAYALTAWWRRSSIDFDDGADNDVGFRCVSPSP